MGWIVRGILFLGGVIAGWFVARDAHIFPVAAFVASLLLFTCFVAALAFWPVVATWVKDLRRKD